MKKIIILALLIIIIMFTAVAITANDAASFMANGDDEISNTANNNGSDTSTADTSPAEEDKKEADKRDEPDKQNEQDKQELYGIAKEPDISEDQAVDPKKPMVALTFDDGPHPEYTIRILNALKKHKARATFFILGNRAEKFKSTVEKIVENGNQIGNHTYDHKQLTRLSCENIKNEIVKTSDILRDISNVRPDILRPTYGSVNNNVKLYAGSPLILWSIDTLDWKTKNKYLIEKEVLSKVKDGDIVLMHDIYKTTAEAAEVIIRKLDEKGYQMVSVKELYTARGIEMENGKVYSNAYK